MANDDLDWLMSYAHKRMISSQFGEIMAVDLKCLRANMEVAIEANKMLCMSDWAKSTSVDSGSGPESDGFHTSIDGTNGSEELDSAIIGMEVSSLEAQVKKENPNFKRRRALFKRVPDHHVSSIRPIPAMTWFRRLTKKVWTHLGCPDAPVEEWSVTDLLVWAKNCQRHDLFSRMDTIADCSEATNLLYTMHCDSYLGAMDHPLPIFLELVKMCEKAMPTLRWAPSFPTRTSPHMSRHANHNHFVGNQHSHNNHGTGPSHGMNGNINGNGAVNHAWPLIPAQEPKQFPTGPTPAAFTPSFTANHTTTNATNATHASSPLVDPARFGFVDKSPRAQRQRKSPSPARLRMQQQQQQEQREAHRQQTWLGPRTKTTAHGAENGKLASNLPSPPAAAAADRHTPKALTTSDFDIDADETLWSQMNRKEMEMREMERLENEERLRQNGHSGGLTGFHRQMQQSIEGGPSRSLRRAAVRDDDDDDDDDDGEMEMGGDAVSRSLRRAAACGDEYDYDCGHDDHEVEYDDTVEEERDFDGRAALKRARIGIVDASEASPQSKGRFTHNQQLFRSPDNNGGRTQPWVDTEYGSGSEYLSPLAEDEASTAEMSGGMYGDMRGTSTRVGNFRPMKQQKKDDNLIRASERLFDEDDEDDDFIVSSNEDDNYEEHDGEPEEDEETSLSFEIEEDSSNSKYVLSPNQSLDSTQSPIYLSTYTTHPLYRPAEGVHPGIEREIFYAKEFLAELPSTTSSTTPSIVSTTTENSVTTHLLPNSETDYGNGRVEKLHQHSTLRHQDPHTRQQSLRTRAQHPPRTSPTDYQSDWATATEKSTTTSFTREGPGGESKTYDTFSSTQSFGLRGGEREGHRQHGDAQDAEFDFEERFHRHHLPPTSPAHSSKRYKHESPVREDMDGVEYEARFDGSNSDFLRRRLEETVTSPNSDTFSDPDERPRFHLAASAKTHARLDQRPTDKSPVRRLSSSVASNHTKQPIPLQTDWRGSFSSDQFRHNAKRKPPP